MRRLSKRGGLDIGWWHGSAVLGGGAMLPNPVFGSMEPQSSDLTGTMPPGLGPKTLHPDSPDIV